jgi:hypothetical protein
VLASQRWIKGEAMTRVVDLRDICFLLALVDASNQIACVQTMHVTLKIDATGAAPSFRDCVNSMGSELEISRGMIHLYGYDIDSKAEFMVHIRGVPCGRIPRLQVQLAQLKHDPTALEAMLLTTMKQRGACSGVDSRSTCNAIDVSIVRMQLMKKEQINVPPPPTPQPYWQPYKSAAASASKASDHAVPDAEPDKFVRFKAGLALMIIFCLISYYQMLTNEGAANFRRAELEDFRSSERMAISFRGGMQQGSDRRPSAYYGSHSPPGSESEEAPAGQKNPSGFDDMWDESGQAAAPPASPPLSPASAPAGLPTGSVPASAR